MQEITKDMLIGDAINIGNQEAICKTLLEIGMHCFGCAIARGETIEDAAAVHSGCRLRSGIPSCPGHYPP